jgi:tetratricopeptide (TPR) repeat protein
LGLILAGSGDYESAERHLTRAADQSPTRFEFVRNLALVQGAAGRTAASVVTLRQAVRLGGDAADLGWLLRIGERALAESGAKPERLPPQPPLREAVMEQVVGRNPEVAEALAARRDDLSAEEGQMLRAARRALVRLLAQHPSYPDLYFGLSLVAEQLGEIDRAIEAAEKALAIHPRYAEACLLAVRLYERKGKSQEAVKRCRQVAELKPQWADVHLRLGDLLSGQGQTAEAAEAYRQALEVNGRCKEAQQRLDGLIHAAGGRGGDG